MTHRRAKSHPAVISSSSRPTSLHVPQRTRQPATPGRPAERSTAPADKKTGKPSTRSQARRIGKYRVVKRLHKGRTSHIMLATTPGIGGVERKVVIKILRSQFAKDQRSIDSLLHEERVTGAMQHQNVVQMVDSGESEYGYFMALEYIKGWNLQQLIEATRASNQRIPLDVALSIAYGVASGLTYLHDFLGDREQRIHVVHRDVQPSNVMITANGFAKLIDFGDVTIEGMDRQQPPMLASVTDYTPPELSARGNIDRRGDVYSLGILLYELLTGHAVRRNEHTGELVPPSALCAEVPEELEALIMRMCHLDPEQRLKSVAILQYAFEDLAGQYQLPLSQRHVAQFARRVLETQSRQRESAPPARQPESAAPAPERLAAPQPAKQPKRRASAPLTNKPQPLTASPRSVTYKPSPTSQRYQAVAQLAPPARSRVAPDGARTLDQRVGETPVRGRRPVQNMGNMERTRVHFRLP